MLPYWKRSKREQKRIRRWARRVLARSQEADLAARTKAAEDAARRRKAIREAQTCSTCEGHGIVSIVRTLSSGQFEAKQAVCPSCKGGLVHAGSGSHA